MDGQLFLLIDFSKDGEPRRKPIQIMSLPAAWKSYGIEIWAALKLVHCCDYISQKGNYRLHSASHWVSPLLGHRGRLLLFTLLYFVLLTFRPPSPGNPAKPGSPWGAKKKELEFPYNLWQYIYLRHLFLPVRLSVQAQALPSHLSAAGFALGCRGWGWPASLREKGTRNTALPAPRGGQSEIFIKIMVLLAWQNCLEHEAIQPRAQLKHVADLFSFGAI